jgi:hypothetical protein
VRRVVLRSRCKYGIMIGETEGIVPAIRTRTGVLSMVD